jgi:hypothetical protein
MMKTIQVLAALFVLTVSGVLHAETGVTRSAFTTAIEDREPVDQVSELSNDTTKIYFFTEISDMYGHAITHRWEQGGEVRAEVTFNVGGDRWRVWSSKNLASSWTGQWTVSVVDEGGNLLTQESFNYVDAASAAEQPAGEDAPAAEPAMDSDSAAPEGSTTEGDMEPAAPPSPPSGISVQ